MKKKYSHNEHFFDEPNILNSYVAGFIAADGNISPKPHVLKIQLAGKDFEFLKRLARTMGYTGPVFEYTRPNHGRAYAYASLTVSAANNIAKALSTNFHIEPKKTFFMKLPDHLPEDCLNAYLVGLIDGDGCITYTNRGQLELNISAGSNIFLIEVARRLNALAPETPSRGKCHGVTPHIDNFQYRRRGKPAYKILSTLDAIPGLPKLERKWSKLSLWQQNQQTNVPLESTLVQP